MAWKKISGIAYREGEEAVATPMRHLTEGLDSLPYPVRTFTDGAVLGRNVTPMLASRSCARTCSFLLHTHVLETVPGKVVRTQKPAKVAGEMRFLLEEHGRSVFLFQDDDYPLFAPVGGDGQTSA